MANVGYTLMLARTIGPTIAAHTVLKALATVAPRAAAATHGKGARRAFSVQAATSVSSHTRTPQAIGPHVRGRVHDTNDFTGTDGPGLRYLVDLQGHSSEATMGSGRERGGVITAGEIAQRISRYMPYYSKNRGGVTVSLGIPMLQHQFVASLFDEVHKLGLTTCLDASGQAREGDQWDAVLSRTDFVLFSLHHLSPGDKEGVKHMKNERALRFAHTLAARNKPYTLRYMYIPGVTDHHTHLDRLIDFARTQHTLQAVELMPYHAQDCWKSAQFRRAFPQLERQLKVPSRDMVSRLVDKIGSAGIKVQCELPFK